MLQTEEANRLRNEVLEKADIVNRLNRTLDDSQRQCQELLKTGRIIMLQHYAVDHFHVMSKQLNFEDKPKEFQSPENWNLLFCSPN